MTDGLQWLDPRDQRFDWLNVADWEAKGDGVQPARVAKSWRQQWPKKTARRAMSSAGMHRIANGVAEALRPILANLC